jgi:hypothetical protein
LAQQVAFHAACDQVLFAFWQLLILKRYHPSLPRLTFLVAIRLYGLDQLAALDRFGSENTSGPIRSMGFKKRTLDLKN